MNEVMNVKHTIKNLLESGVTSYQIEKETSVSRAKIGRLRNGKNKIDNLTLETIEKLYNYQKGLEVMEKSIEIKDQNNIVLIDSLGQFFTDIENDGNYFNIDYALLNEVEYNEKVYFEVGTYRTEEVSFDEEVTEDNVSELEDRWLQTDQSGENYIESVFFENEQDATDYITLVLKGNKNFADTAKAVGVFE
ncbi:TPA: hypothetical protein ACJI4S_002204 [Staphylococcus pseudintermedius]|uniref:hypothetical protein n=1 Tax=Staphylococcus coagulans TaxID=74706 RepID=UPI003860BA09